MQLPILKPTHLVRVPIDRISDGLPHLPRPYRRWLIMLDRRHLGLLDIEAERNAFGRQLRSIEADLEFDGLSGTLDQGGTVNFNGVNVSPGIVLNAAWTVFSSTPNHLGGNLVLLWTNTIVAGTSTITGSIASVSHTGSLPRSVSPRTTEDLLRALTGGS